ncbi:hypothetical protein NXW86_30030 [Bacteroides thetaiotaomicron]|nr:hypothetical protein [Bacteroides thetaiotaomicron]MCS2453199.1 hypothetical protein [Bacteroides thetaiotaomicron]
MGINTVVLIRAGLVNDLLLLFNACWEKKMCIIRLQTWSRCF